MEIGTWTSFPHTADIGVEVSAPTLVALFSTAAFALFDLLIETTPSKTSRTSAGRLLAVHAGDPPELLIRWLSELLYIYETEHLVLRGAEIHHLSSDSLTAMVTWEPFDPACDGVRREIKAVTYHQAGIDEIPDGWRARVIFDV